jgi:hypothetical protein
MDGRRPDCRGRRLQGVVRSRLHRTRGRAAKDLPHRLEAVVRRRPAAGARRDDRVGRLPGRLRDPVLGKHRVQTSARYKPEAAHAHRSREPIGHRDTTANSLGSPPPSRVQRAQPPPLRQTVPRNRSHLRSPCPRPTRLLLPDTWRRLGSPADTTGLAANEKFAACDRRRVCIGVRRLQAQPTP